MNELLAKNQAQLNELHADIKEVSKISGEATVNVRKINKRIVFAEANHSNQENKPELDNAASKIGNDVEIV